MTNHYRITVEALQDGVPVPEAPLVFTADSHDDIFAIVGRVKAKGIVPDEQVPAFVTGLKLFGGVLLKNRAHPLFFGFKDSFAGFMKALKAS